MKQFATIALCFLFAFVNHVEAQAKRGDQQSKGAYDRIESYKKVRMLEVLKLEEDQSVKFMTRYNQHLDTMHGFDKERNELVDKLDAQTKGDVKDTEYDETIGGLLSLDKKISGERQKFLDELKEVLSHKQIAEYIVFERHFAQELRQAIRDVQKERLKEH